jgi:hypothetical protein
LGWGPPRVYLGLLPPCVPPGGLLLLHEYRLGFLGQIQLQFFSSTVVDLALVVFYRDILLSFNFGTVQVSPDLVAVFSIILWKCGNF